MTLYKVTLSSVNSYDRDFVLFTIVEELKDIEKCLNDFKSDYFISKVEFIADSEINRSTYYLFYKQDPGW